MRGIFKSVISFSLCGLLLMLPFTANAHSGRTDSSGGHNCSEKSIAKGLCTGYHYHNGGSSSGSTSESTPSTPVYESEPQIDEEQVLADQYYETANDYYNSGDYEDAINELEQIYDLNNSDSKTNNLVQKSVIAIYELAETAVNEGDYLTAKEHLSYINKYQRTSNQMKQKADKLIVQIAENEEIEDLFSNATIARDEKNYKESLGYIQQAKKIKESEKIKSFYNETVQDLINDAEAAYNEKQFKQAKKFYTLLVKITATPKLKAQYQQYQMILQQIQNEQILQGSFGIASADLKGKSLYNHLMEEENETPYSETVVNSLKDLLDETKEDVMSFIFTINIKELFKGGEKDAV